jgi:hypothetical protein
MTKNKPADSGNRPAPKPAPLAEPEQVAPLFRRIDWLTFAITSALMWAVYFFTLAPQLTLQDSGELAVGSFYAGVPHPPGYPVWTIYTWLWTVLLPIGNIAWRVALAEATAGALSCGLLGFIVSRGSSMLVEGIEELKEMTGKWENATCLISGVVAGLLMGLNGYMWSQSVIVEVYVFGVLSFMIVLVCLLRWIHAPHQMRYAYWALFMFGVCFTNHQSLIVAAIGIEIAIAAASPKLGRDVLFGNGLIYLVYLLVLAVTGEHIFRNLGAKPGLLVIFHGVGVGSLAAGIWLTSKTKGFLTEWKHVIIMGALWLLGASFYFYMPLAGMTNPPMQWGYPRTVEGFLHALTRGQYEQPNPTNLLTEPGRFSSQMWMLFTNLTDEFTWVYAFLALVPFMFFRKMQRREKSWIIGLTAIYLCLGVLLMMLLNPPPDRASADLVKVFFAASHTIVAALIGYGLALTAAFMATHYRNFRFWAMGGSLVAMVLAICELVKDTGNFYFGEGSSASLGQVFGHITGVFSGNYYGVPIYAGLLLLALTVIFFLALLIYRQRAPLAITLAVFALMPVNALLINWYDNEQRGHYFGYWFGHDMFTPPFKAADGKSLYPEMTKDAILYGGTDPGRFCPTYMIFCESFAPGYFNPVEDKTFDRRDVYIITQNALADGTYLNYIRAHYNRSEQNDPPFFQELFRGAKEKELNYKTNLVAKAVRPLDKLFTGIGDRIEKKRRASTSYFTPKDFTDINALATKLRPGASQDAVSKFLYDNLRPETQKLLAETGAGESLKRPLARDLTAIIEREVDIRKRLAAAQQEKNGVDQELTYGDPSAKLRRRQEALAKEIAELSAFKPLYDAERFKEVNISEYLQDFIKENPQSHTRIRLNRLLLEAAYPAQISKSLGGVYPDREMYIATPTDSQRCFQEYLADANKRLQHDSEFPNEPRQIKPGEDVRVMDNRVQVSGQIAVMSINGLLTKVMFDANPKNEFFVEESFPLDWMYPHLTPFGIIMKINRQPLASLSNEILDRDHAFWREYSKRLTGDIVNYDTPVKEIAAWVEKVYVHRDFRGIVGDRKFIRDNDAQKAFSKLRSSIAGVYSWRLGPQCPPEYRPKTPEEFQRLAKEADFAFRQAFAFCPYSPEAVFRYVNLLMQFQRIDDATLVAETCLRLDPYNSAVVGLVDNLRAIKQQQGAMLQQQQLQQQQMQLQIPAPAQPTAPAAPGK